MKAKTAIWSELRLQSCIGEMRAAFKRSGYLSVQYSDAKPRSLNQNALAAAWYEHVSRELGEDTPAGVKRLCKLHAGVPILRRDDEEFRAAYDAAIKPLPYEKKLLAIGLMPVTSLMSTDQLSEYLTEVQTMFSGRVALEFPDQGRFAA